LRTIAVSRFYLDNVDDITVYWVGLVPQNGMTQVALSDGADDLHGTSREENPTVSMVSGSLISKPGCQDGFGHASPLALGVRSAASFGRLHMQ